jgi:hypothetical protein
MAYNIIDANENVITENITEEAALELIENNSNDVEVTYFYYPLDAEVLAELKQKFENTDSLRFFKRIVEEA